MPSLVASSRITAFCEGVYSFATRVLSVRRAAGSAVTGAVAAAAGSSRFTSSAGFFGSRPAFGSRAVFAFGLRVAFACGLRAEASAGGASRRTPAVAAHRLTHVCGTPCFFAASLTPNAGTSATAAARCFFV